MSVIFLFPFEDVIRFPFSKSLPFKIVEVEVLVCKMVIPLLFGFDEWLFFMFWNIYLIHLSLHCLWYQQEISGEVLLVLWCKEWMFISWVSFLVVNLHVVWLTIL